MFTNWLTSPTTSSLNSTISGGNSSSNLLGHLPTNLMATPPDIILEVGPSPTVRFVAHSTLLSMHSGYLRSAIRIDENLLISGDHQHHHHHHNSDTIDLPPIFLTNVTPEQFGPLLTYMYTGYLDLTLENIFGVLLATHVLHMPRALEICRAFLSRSQSEGYLNNGFLNQIDNNNLIKNGCKIIRPIASKPIISNLGFIVPPQIQNISLTSSNSTPFRSLNSNNNNNISSNQINEDDNSQQQQILNPKLQKTDNSSTLSIKLSKSSPIIPTKEHTKRSPKLKRISTTSSSSEKSRIKISTSSSSLSIICNKDTNNQLTTVTAPQSLNHDNENKIIIDVASCDGPVRFRRVLNDSYGRQPDSVHLPTPQSERNHQSLSYSFHQQMAKNINQQQRQQQQQQQNFHNHSDESENSEDLRNCNIDDHQLNNQQNCPNNNNCGGLNNNNNDVYNCIYCKHTFKSQYCYQKHAKRHLNPLSLEHGEGIILAPSITTFGELTKDEKIISKTAIPVQSLTNNNNNRKTINTTEIRVAGTAATSTNENSKNNNNKISGGNSSSSGISKSSTRASNSNNNNNNTNTSIIGPAITEGVNKREVRPLDMNVQYYPCKTCGSKFPSYYFVHKHRKMCHANEEN